MKAITIGIGAACCAVLLAAAGPSGPRRVEYGRLAVSGAGTHREYVWTSGTQSVDLAGVADLLKNGGVKVSEGVVFVGVLDRIGADGWRLIDRHDEPGTAAGQAEAIYLFER